MKKLVLLLSVVFITCSSFSQVRPDKFAISSGASFGVFTDEYINEIYNAHPSYRGMIGYEFSNWGIYGFADYYEVSGNPFVKATNYDYGTAGAELKSATVGVELRKFFGETFFLLGEVGSTEIQEHLWADGISATNSSKGTLYGVGAGYEFTISGALKGEFETIYSSAKIKSPGKEMMAGDESASLGKLVVCLSIKF